MSIGFILFAPSQCWLEREHCGDEAVAAKKLLNQVPDANEYKALRSDISYVHREYVALMDKYSTLDTPETLPRDIRPRNSPETLPRDTPPRHSPVTIFYPRRKRVGGSILFRLPGKEHNTSAYSWLNRIVGSELTLSLIAKVDQQGIILLSLCHLR